MSFSMAASVAFQSPLVPCPCSASLFSNPFQTLEPNATHFSSLSFPHARHPMYSCKPLLGFTSKSSPFCNVNRRNLFKSYLAAEGSIPNTNDDKLSPSSLNALIEAYREACLDGDEKTVSHIEMRIQSMANKKNELIQRASTLSADKVASKDKYLRLQANFDNFRKRFEKEKLNIQSNAQEEVIEKLLLMVDNFERAKQQIKPATEKEKKIGASYQGIYKQFVEIMRSHGVSVVATVGKRFDPLLHEAIAREESQKYKEGIIIQESRRGFLLRNRLLRPALVKVSSGPGNNKSTVTADKSNEHPAAAAGIDER